MVLISKIGHGIQQKFKGQATFFSLKFDELHVNMKDVREARGQAGREGRKHAVSEYK